MKQKLLVDKFGSVALGTIGAPILVWPMMMMLGEDLAGLECVLFGGRIQRSMIDEWEGGLLVCCCYYYYYFLKII